MPFVGQAVFGGQVDPVTSVWTNATALNTAVVSSDLTGFGVVAVSFVVTGTITGGTAIFEISDDGGTTWWAVNGLQTGFNTQAMSYALAGGSASYEFATGAYNLFRVRLNPVITGSGSVAIRIFAEAFPFVTTLAVAGTVSVVTVPGNNHVITDSGSTTAVTGTVAVTQSGAWTVAATQSGTWNVTVNSPLPAGTNVIGHVITDSGSTTAVTGTVAVNNTQWNSVALGSPSNFGTSPGTVAVIGSNAALFASVGGTQTALTGTGTSLNVNITGGATSGTQYTNGTAVATGSLVGTEALGYDGANVRAILTSATGQQHVLTDSGSTTVVTGTVAVTQSTSPWVVSLTSTTITGTVAVTQSTSPWVVSLTSTTITGTVAVTQSTSPWAVAGAAASGAAKSGNPVQGGAVFNTTQPTVTNGQVVENQATARGAQIVATGVDGFNVTNAGTFAVQAAQSGTWTVAVSGTVGVTQSTSPWVVSLTSTTITGTVAVTQSTSPWVVGGNLTHNNAAPTTNNIGVLPAVASAGAPTYTTADQVLLSTDLSGNLRVVGSFSSGALPDLVGTLVALNALNAAAVVNAFGYNSIGMFIAAGTLAGTVVAECSYDGGTTWVATSFDDPATGNKTATLVFTNPNAATSRHIIGSGGASNYRVRVSAFTSGTANCTLRANLVDDPSALFTGAAGSALPSLVADVGGSVTTAAPAYTTATMNALSLTTAGGLRTDHSSLAGTTLGAPSNYGTSPGAVAVQGVNAFITNTVPVTLTSTTITGTVAVTQSTSPWVVNTTQWASTVLGVPQTFGTVPTGVVIGTSSDLYVAGTRARSNQTTTAAGVVDVNNVGIDGTTIVTAAAGVQKVGIVGNTGATLDTSNAQNQAMPTNMLITGGEFNTAPTTITSGNSSPLQLTSKGTLIVGPGTENTASNAWFEKITDGTNTSAVKAASTTPVATDPALVVTLSPNSAVVNVATVQGTEATYRVTSGTVASNLFTSSFTPHAGVIFQLQGSATQVVRITHFSLSSSGSSATYIDVSAQRTSTAASGGTAVTPTVAKADLSDPTATAIGKYYTAAPTPGTFVANYVAERFFFPQAPYTMTYLDFMFGDLPGAKGFALQGTSDFFTVQLTGSLPATPFLSFYCEWTEAST